MSSYAKITLNHAALRRLDQAAARALPQAGTAVLKDIKKAQVIPLDTSHLQNDSTFVDSSHIAEGHVDIVSSTPYARRLYYNPESQSVAAHEVKEHTVKEHTVKGYTRKDGTYVKGHTVKEHTVRAHTVGAYTAGKMRFRQEADEDHNRANANAKDHWFEEWADGGERANVAQEAFAAAFKREAGL